MNTLHRKILLGLIVILVGLSCSISKNNQLVLSCFQENRLSFFDPTDSSWPDSNTVYSTWIRKPENIKIIHENFKKIGYQSLINYGHFGEWNSDKRPLKQRIDSLLITYYLDTVPNTYYREFWQRRNKEKNSLAVYETLLEVKQILNGSKIDYNQKYLNDTLINLVNIQFSEDSLDIEIANNNFEYLRSIGLHQSAYNILFERYSYYDIEWNKTELVSKLITDTTCKCINPWIQDNTK